MQEQDRQIVARVAELAARIGCTVTQVALAWHFAKGVASTLIGATKAKCFADAAGAFDVMLSADEIYD